MLIRSFIVAFCLLPLPLQAVTMIPSTVTIREGSSVTVRIDAGISLPLGATCGPSDANIATGGTSIPQGGSQADLVIFGRSAGRTPVVCLITNFARAPGSQIVGTVTVSELPCPPRILSQTSILTVFENEDARLVVVVEGKAPVSFQWYVGKSGDISKPIPSANSNAFRASSSRLGETEYWVRVTSPCGFTDSSTIQLIVQDCSTFKIIAQPQSQSATLGQRVTVSVHVTTV